jgi:hypothetical protein
MEDIFGLGKSTDKILDAVGKALGLFIILTEQNEKPTPKRIGN